MDQVKSRNALFTLLESLGTYPIFYPNRSADNAGTKDKADTHIRIEIVSVSPRISICQLSLYSPLAEGDINIPAVFYDFIASSLTFGLTFSFGGIDFSIDSIPDMNQSYKDPHEAYYVTPISFEFEQLKC